MFLFPTFIGKIPYEILKVGKISFTLSQSGIFRRTLSQSGIFRRTLSQSGIFSTNEFSNIQLVMYEENLSLIESD